MQMQKSILIAGGGTICPFYKEAIEQSPLLYIAGLCDVNKDCLGKQIFPDAPFFNDIQTAIQAIRPVYVLLSTPTTAHADTIQACLDMNSNVLVEKPMATDLNVIRSLYEEAEQKRRRLRCMFHYRYANEILFFIQQFDMFANRLGAIKEIETTFYDPYAHQNGIIAKDRVSLMGAWNDAGINVLSLLDAVLEITEYQKLDETYFYDETCGYPVFAQKRFHVSGKRTESCLLTIKIDWRENRHDKQTKIRFEHGEIEISHSTQGVYYNGRTFYEKNTDSRLREHYNNLFRVFDDEKQTMEQERALSLKLHEMLLI